MAVDTIVRETRSDRSDPYSQRQAPQLKASDQTIQTTAKNRFSCCDKVGMRMLAVGSIGLIAGGLAAEFLMEPIVLSEIAGIGMAITLPHVLIVAGAITGIVALIWLCCACRKSGPLGTHVSF